MHHCVCVKQSLRMDQRGTRGALVCVFTKGAVRLHVMYIVAALSVHCGCVVCTLRLRCVYVGAVFGYIAAVVCTLRLLCVYFGSAVYLRLRCARGRSGGPGPAARDIPIALEQMNTGAHGEE